MDEELSLLFSTLDLEKLIEKSFQQINSLSFEDLMPGKMRFSDLLARAKPDLFRNFLVQIDEQGKLFFLVMDFYILLSEYLTGNWNKNVYYG